MSENLVQSEQFKQNTETAVNEIILEDDLEIVSIVSDFAYEPRRLEEKGAKQAVKFISDNLIKYGWNVKNMIFLFIATRTLFFIHINLKMKMLNFLEQVQILLLKILIMILKRILLFCPHTMIRQVLPAKQNAKN